MCVSIFVTHLPTKKYIFVYINKYVRVCNIYMFLYMLHCVHINVYMCVLKSE